MCILPWQQKKELIFFLYRRRKLVDLWRYSCTKVQRKLFHVALFSFWKEIGFILLRCKYLYYIWIRLSTIKFIAYLFLSTRFLIEVGLIGTAMLCLKMNLNKLIWNMQGQHHIENMKSTAIWLDFELQMLRFLHIVPKGSRGVYNFS